MLVVLALALAAPTQTNVRATAPDKDSVVMWVAARPEECNLSIARRVKFAALTRKPGSWAGQCIAVTGYWHRRALFESPSDARLETSQSSDELDGHRVGIYARDEVFEAAPTYPKKVTAVGIAGTCEQLWDGAMMVMGYCHYTGGPYIAVAEIRSR